MLAEGFNDTTRVPTGLGVLMQNGNLGVFGFFETREAGHWGEGGSNLNSTPTKLVHPTSTSTFAIPGVAATKTGGSFDFNHWDLAEARQLADIRPDYHMIKNYKFLGRFDTFLIKDADFFAFYRPWYDAEGTLKNKGRAEPFTDAVNYSHRELQQQYFKNDLREYYAQLNFTDNFSARIGKQQIIWSEADALSGTSRLSEDRQQRIGRLHHPGRLRRRRSDSSAGRSTQPVGSSSGVESLPVRH